MHPRELRQLLLRVLAAMIFIHSLWWFADADQWVLAALKVPMEILIPAVVDEVLKVTRSAEVGGGWNLLTSVLVNNNANLSLHLSAFVLAKCVFWIPSSLALTLATAPKNLVKLVTCFIVALLVAGLLVLVCSAAQLAIFLNPEPGIWSELNPRPPGLELSVAPYPGWYFFVVSLGFYFTLNVAMLALPIVLWVLVCWREIGVLLQADPKKS
jgi:hypothetical protein